jgi:energy-coupling factor transport system ATP-binding protein
MGIQFSNVGYAYKGHKVTYDAIKNINIKIEAKGEFIAICGETGSGKSTLVQHMNALLLPTSGTSQRFWAKTTTEAKRKD